MMKLIQLILFSCVATDAMAQTNQLQFVGQPVQNRNTNEVIAMVCVDVTCTQVQAAYFKDLALSEPKYFGAVYENTSETHEQFKDDYKKDQRRTYLPKAEFYGALVSGIGLAMGAFAQSFWIGAGVALVGGVIMVVAENGAFRGITSTQVSTAIKNQDGWNWSIGVERVSASRFNSFYWFIFENHCCAIRKHGDYFITSGMTTSSYDFALEAAHKNMNELHICSGIADYTKVPTNN